MRKTSSYRVTIFKDFARFRLSHGGAEDCLLGATPCRLVNYQFNKRYGLTSQNIGSYRLYCLPRLCFTPVYFTPFCFKASFQFALLLNLRSLVSV